MKAYLTIVLMGLLLLGCQTEQKKQPNLLADREAPLGWVSLKAYPDNTFEFIVSGLRQRDVYPGTYSLTGDTLVFHYTKATPALNSNKAVIKDKYIVYLGGTYPERVEIKVNELKRE